MNKMTAYVHTELSGHSNPKLYFSPTEGSEWQAYDGRPYDECAAIGFEHRGEMVVFDLVLLRHTGGYFPVRIGHLPIQGLPE